MERKDYIKRLELQEIENDRLCKIGKIEFKGDEIEKLDDEINRLKSKNYKGLFNLSDEEYRKTIMNGKESAGRVGIYKLDVYDALCHIRDDFVCVNKNQYQIIYDKKISENTHKENRKVAVEYTINHDDPFFILVDDFFGKKSKAKGFLIESEKVAIAPEMMLVPFFCRGTYYYLTIDNLTEQISLDSVNTAFKHINRQSNLYYQISSAISKELRDDYDEFEHHFLKKMRKATGINSKLLKENYKNPDRLLNSKYFYNTILSK